MIEKTAQPLVVGVRFSKVGKVYHFTANSVTDIKVGDRVVVETSRGWQLGQVAQVLDDATPPPEGWKEIDRRATPRDLLLRQMWQMKEAEVVENCRNRARELRLAGIKIVSAEYSFDGARLTILFSSETEEKYDLKSLRSDMQKMFAPSQVEMRQVGPRDVAKVHCGMGACGLETRCCCLFLTEFSSISIRMAKEQGISLTPTEITGMCGRLRCCLIYEYDTYVDARAKLPKRNKRVRTPQGEGKVVDVIPLRGSVIVELPEVGRREFSGSEVTLVDESGAQPAPQFTGTRQPSEMDQARAGEADPESFVISEEAPGEPSGGQGGPSGGETSGTERPPQAQQRPSRGNRGRDRHGGPGGGQKPGKAQGSQPERRGGHPQRKGPRPEKPQGPAGQPPAGERPPGAEANPGGEKWKRRDRRPGPQGGRPKGEAGGGGESRKNKGQRRDSNDSENRT